MIHKTTIEYGEDINAEIKVHMLKCGTKVKKVGILDLIRRGIDASKEQDIDEYIEKRDEQHEWILGIKSE